jgi:decaprenylphospho-beta-D-ribofuranose 2-oxidase
MNIYQKKISGWGRVRHAATQMIRPEFISELHDVMQIESQSIIARGCGRSYGDQAVNSSGLTLITTRLNRLISFDHQTLELTCESGVTLRDIQMTFLPRGFGLVTSPGTACVSVGGAIANDVHGKNHDRVGSFGCHVVWFELLIASGEIIRCSRTENKAIFFATIGGLGLTGVITTVCLKLQKQPFGVTVNNELTPDIKTLIARLLSVRDSATYSVAWIDMMSRHQFGRGILSVGEPVEMRLIDFCQSRHSFSRLAAPFLNDYSMQLFNQFYYYRASTKEKIFSQSLPQFLYPLDKVNNWNKVYGKKGFYQFQCVLPENNAQNGIVEICETVKASEHRCYLAVLKTLGDLSEGLLSFPMRGLTIALDFPNKPGITLLLKKLQAITVAHQGRVYFAKDACMESENLLAMYPNLSAFQKVLMDIDPQHKWQSDMKRRLNICAQ